MVDGRHNPLLEPSPLPFGLPLFALIRAEHYREALEHGMAAQRREVEAIASDASPATFENTIVALERSGALLRRVLPVFENASSAVADDEIDAIETEFAPRLAAHRDAILLDPRLFARIEAVVADRPALDAESAYLLERRHRVAVLAGAALDEAGRAELTALNRRIATLTTDFQQRLLADTNELALHVTDESELSGLDAAQRGSARAAARARGREGWLITLVLPTGQPLLAALDDPAVRDRLLAASRARGASGGAHDTRETLLELVRVRARRARLLGVENHAAAVTADSTAGSPEAVADLLGRLAPAARANARREAVALEARASRDGRRRGRGIRLVVPRRAGAGRAPRGRPAGDAPLLRGRPGARRRRVPRGGPALRRPSHRARRPRRIPRRHAGVRGRRTRRQPGGPVPARPVRARLEARRRLDELTRRAIDARRAPCRSSSTTSTFRSRPRATRRC